MVHKYQSNLKGGNSILSEFTKAEIQLYSRIDDMKYHTPYDDWSELYDIVKNSDSKRLTTYLETKIPGKPGKLSNNLLQQKKYEAVTALTFLMGALKEKGCDHETAVNLMDYYIYKIDCCANELLVKEVRKEAYYEYVKLAPLILKDIKYSLTVSKAIDYIMKNIYYDLSISELAREVSISKRKLAETFKKETGITIIDYIKRQKIKMAKDLLKHTQLSYSEISARLNFCSQSYFIKVFQEIEGITPKRFREMC